MAVEEGVKEVWAGVPIESVRTSKGILHPTATGGEGGRREREKHESKSGEEKK